jgi:cbb3-type cytochrome oxidase subunit 3
MFLGHYGLALMSKRAAPRSSLGTLSFAAQFADELWPILLLLGVEEVRIVPGMMTTSPLDFVHYPFSHSLATLLLAGLCVGGIAFALTRNARSALVLGALVASHWFLDFPFHRPDLPLWPGGMRVGLSLWNFRTVTWVCELGLYGAGLAVYLRSTQAKDRIGRWGIWAMAICLVGIYASTELGPPPPNPTVLAWSGLGLWLFVAWSAWVDRHRTPVDGHA